MVRVWTGFAVGLLQSCVRRRESSGGHLGMALLVSATGKVIDEGPLQGA